MTTLRNAFWVLALGCIACFVFFFALGAISPADMVGVTVAVGVLCAMWAVHAWLQAHGGHVRDPRLSHERERRGF